MGKAEARQSKLQFEQRRPTKLISDNAGASEGEEQPPDCSQDDIDMKTLLVAMKRSLSSIETKMDNMCSRLDMMEYKRERTMMGSYRKPNSGFHKSKISRPPTKSNFRAS
ncbi:hypothetical protein NDU88_004883 [Pleurodeles waltl]|uniref:Uncharacterized protein n=1 Tax=Pleurodeles waltl TaxID=8319 RepID=A0AAV7QJM0_PLEWA|nr:hypothetical protein NDU88_004883 [Pleurodeles waltl]